MVCEEPSDYRRWPESPNYTSCRIGGQVTNLGGQVTNVKRNVKRNGYLGVIIDEHLDWIKYMYRVFREKDS